MDIDLNCDLGEGAGADAELLALVTTANVACGLHAGGPSEALAALRAAARHGVRVGAHPSFPDREHFGRQEMSRAEGEVFADCVYQIGALAALAAEAGLALTHVKPHGALYNQACRDDAYARPVVEAAAHFRLALLGLPNSRLQALATGKCPFVAEGFADRRYRPDGSLVPRTEPDAFVHDPAEAVAQVERLARDFGVRTVCVHGDGPHALDFVRALRAELPRRGFALKAFA
jgi:5-oxoprolinase (ATP-hydrolysing) subunit A